MSYQNFSSLKKSYYPTVSIGQESEISAQSLKRLKLRFQLDGMWRLSSYLNFWKNSFPISHMTEVPIYLLSVFWGPLSSSRQMPLSGFCYMSPSIGLTFWISSFKTVLSFLRVLLIGSVSSRIIFLLITSKSTDRWPKHGRNMPSYSQVPPTLKRKGWHKG